MNIKLFELEKEKHLRWRLWHDWRSAATRRRVRVGSRLHHGVMVHQALFLHLVGCPHLGLVVVVVQVYK